MLTIYAAVRYIGESCRPMQNLLPEAGREDTTNWSE